MILYHASKELVPYPEIRKAQFTKDFSWGFYCTSLYEQAVRWANRGVGEPVINFYDYQPKPGLKILKFEEMDDAWLDFIASCRSGNTHDYDIVEGPMANDTVWNFVNDYIHGNLTKEQFWVLARFRRPTQQISFHTLSAINCLTFQKGEIVHDK